METRQEHKHSFRFGNKIKTPDGWEIKKLREIAELSAGGTPSTLVKEYWENGTIPWLSSGEVRNSIITSSREKITDIGLSNSSAKIFPKGTVLIAITGQGLTRGRTALLEIDAATNQSIIGIVCKPDRAYNLFLWYSLQNEYWKLRSISQGSNQAGLNLTILREYKIILPSLSEQNKIASILSKIDDLIHKTDEIIEQTQRLKKGLMQKLLTKGIGHTRFKKTKLGEIPEEWNVLHGKDACSEIVVGIVIKPASLYSKEGVPCLRSFNIREDEINEKDIVLISEESNELNSKSRLREGDVLIVRTGYPGTSCVVPKKFTGGNCIDLVIARPNIHLDSFYLSRFINSDVGKAQVLKSQAGLAQQHFNVGEMRNMLIPIPTHSEQLKIVTILSNISSQVKVNLEYKFKLETLKKGLMQKLLTGKIRVKV
jgi:type I restriction enzyme S subunit